MSENVLYIESGSFSSNLKILTPFTVNGKPLGVLLACEGASDPRGFFFGGNEFGVQTVFAASAGKRDVQDKVGATSFDCFLTTPDRDTNFKKFRPSCNQEVRRQFTLNLGLIPGYKESRKL